MIEAIITGILAGFIAAKLTGGEGKGCWIDLFLGLVGGVVGNWLLGLLVPRAGGHHALRAL